MHTLEIPEIKFKAKFASCIDELTSSQFVYFCKLIAWFQVNQINESDFKLLMLVKLLKIRFNPAVYKKHPLSLLESCNLFQLQETLNSFFTDKTLNLSFSRNLLPSLRVSFFKRKLHGPLPYLTNCSFFEYIEAQRHFIAFSKTEDYAELDKLIACLYRPAKYFHFIRKYLPNYDGDIRQKFNDNQVERRAKQIAKLPPEMRFGVYLFFKNCEENFQTGEMEINQNVISFRELFKKSDETDKTLNLGWVGLLYSLAESCVFGNIKETANQNVYDVLLRVYQVIKDNEKIAEKYGKNKDVS